ncbi:MAG TPA: tRNA epoxyqueuosine(34) reductase QueG [Ignavibacteriaceae bacterium]|nr:tRNA epoxyqueuosine(34) reductase QueG [Ignavibacteriaceae bacterium]
MSYQNKITNDIVIQKAKAIGFDLVGFAKAEILYTETEKLNEWLSLGYQAGMDYMEKNLDKRKNVKNILNGAKSIISLGLNYHTEENYSDDELIKSKQAGKISRYAWGKDYHLVIWKLLNELENSLKEIDPIFESLSYVDTGPVMDKAWAVRSGIGWLGKHTNVINRELGSWIFLSNIICNYEFEYSSPIPDFCGSCTACIEACPTGAIVQKYVVDSNKCISYLTIENKNEIPDVFKDKFDNWLFGCDICQDVCPWNLKFTELTHVKVFYPLQKELQVDEVLMMNEEEFKEKFQISPVKRAKLKGLKRNASFLKH